MMYHVVLYSGPLGFIKPYNAMRDELIHTQQFLSPGTVSGINKRLFGPEAPEKILRHKLDYDAISAPQTEAAQSLDLRIRPQTKEGKKGYYAAETRGIVQRQLLVNPRLYLAFGSEADARTAMRASICLIRNEDLVFPDPEFSPKAMTDEAFFALRGFELRYNLEDPTEKTEGAFPVGRSQYIEGSPMCYGTLDINLDG